MALDEDFTVSVKMRKRDWDFLDFVSRELKTPKIDLLSTCIALLCLLILRSEQVYFLFKEVVEDGKT